MSLDMRVASSGDHAVKRDNLLTVTNGLLVTAVALAAIAFLVGLFGVLASQGVNLEALNALYVPIPSYVSGFFMGFGGTTSLGLGAGIIAKAVYSCIPEKKVRESVPPPESVVVSPPVAPPANPVSVAMQRSSSTEVYKGEVSIRNYFTAPIVP